MLKTVVLLNIFMKTLKFNRNSLYLKWKHFVTSICFNFIQKKKKILVDPKHWTVVYEYDKQTDLFSESGRVDTVEVL